MRDTQWLETRLRVALLLPLLATGCNGSKVAGSGAPCSMPMSWCGEIEVAERARVGVESELGCPKSVQGNTDEHQAAIADGGRYEGPPLGYAPSALSVERTRERRSDGGEAGACCYEWEGPCPGGRPLLEANGNARVAPVVPGNDWLGEAAAADASTPADDRTRRALARQWLRDAQLEHASIASFARATLELLALGAPPELIAKSQQAALDEIRHAEQCFALASRYAGRSLRPGPLAAAMPREADFGRLARDTFVEGCFGETVAALAAARAAEVARDPDVKAVLDGIARDEAEHAALAWATLRWALGRAPDAVIAAVRCAAEELLRARPSRPSDETAPSLAEFGRLDAAMRQSTRADAHRDIIAPLLTELGILTPGGVA